MPFCTACGKQNPDDARFCAQCGTKLLAGEDTGAPPVGASPVESTATITFGVPDQRESSDRQLSPEEKRDIVAYVRESAETPSPGGLGLGGFGPTSEGMAAWIIGMVAVIAAALWIGARA